MSLKDTWHDGDPFHASDMDTIADAVNALEISDVAWAGTSGVLPATAGQHLTTQGGNTLDDGSGNVAIKGGTLDNVTIGATTPSPFVTANNFVAGWATTVTSGTPIVLTVSSAHTQEFTGTTAQAVDLPVTNVVAGMEWKIINASSQTLAVNGNGGANINSLLPGQSGTYIAKVNAPSYTGWDYTVAGSALPAYGTAATASTIAERDSNGALTANNFIPGSSLQAASATTLSLFANSPQVIVITGTTQNQTITLPPGAAGVGQSWRIINATTAATVTCNAYLGGTVATLPAGTNAVLVALSTTPTTTAGWQAHTAEAFVTPQMYGCAGDGTTDDTANLSACLNSGFPVLLVGKFRITSTITVALSKSSNPQGLHIKGAGGMQSQIILDNTAASLVITIGAYDNPVGAGAKVTLSNFRMTPNVAAITGYAITISSSVAEAGSSQPNFAIDNVDVTPASASFYCAGGFMLQDVRYGTVKGCSLDGHYGVAAGAGGNGITFYSAVNLSAPVNTKIIGCSLAYWEKGIEMRPKSPAGTAPTDPEGLYIIGTDFLSCNYGVYATTLDGSGGSITMADCMVSHGTAGVYMLNTQYCFIHDCFFLSNPISGITSSTGIWVDVTTSIGLYSNFHDNLFNFANSGSIATRRGIYSTSGGSVSIRTNINNNTCLNATTAYTIVLNTGGTNSGNASY